MEDAMKPWEETETEILEEGLRQRQARLQTNTDTVKGNGKEADFTGLENGGLDFSPPKMNSGEEELNLPAENLGTQMNGEINIQQEEIEKKKILPDANPISEGFNSSNNVTSEGGKVSLVKEIEQEVRELYLERVYQKPETHAFYCPNCRTCIQKVLIQNQELENARVPVQQPRQIDTFTCTSCFSFLIPIGSWLFPRLVFRQEEAPIDDGVPVQGLLDQTAKDGPENKPPEADQSVRLSQSVARNPLEVAVNTVVDSGNQVLKREQVITDGANKVATEVGDKITDLGSGIEKDIEGTDSSIHLRGILQDEGGEDASSRKKISWTSWAAISGAFVVKGGDDASRKKYSGADWAAISGPLLATKHKETEIDSTENVYQQPQLEQVIVDGVYKSDNVVGDAYGGPAEQALHESPIDVATTEPEVIQEPESSSTWEILKSIVYGGLAESIASLGVVTSAASADATTINIVALALANLVGGLFILFHNLWELKSEQPRRANYSETNAAKDRYYELLGKKENFFLHATFAVFSFILFGLVPPLVYGFSFHESGEKDFKLAAVAVASLLCITLLAIAKAYIQRSTGYLTYLKTVLFYVSTGAMASIVAYLAGDLIKKLIEKLGWFESSSDSQLLLPEMSMGKRTWGSY
ncbi:hypothetical protein L6164_003189 [Bauhinia variegata]|uniref:Uncharacterized protein n=1 Tax=Bauhinia variegata TaxID=167791 RepID=A0ACB9Q2V8_BAUVA|nr:hypothetical protein L6164_003189 [Bauhinia variegata]